MVEFVTGSCFVALLLVVTVVVTIRLGTFAYHVGRRKAERYLKETEGNGKVP